jgi:tetratricopeptide (TPR) repeat protein
MSFTRVALFTVLLLMTIGSPLIAGEKPSETERLLKEADNTFNSRDYAGATELYRALVEKAEEEGDKAVLVQALAMTARGYLIRGMNDEGRPWIERAGELASPDDPPGWSRYLGVRGRFEWQDGDKPKATLTFREMYGYCLEHELYRRAIDAAHMVAITGTTDEQIEWARKGIAAAEQGGEEGWLGPLWNNLGVTYWDLAAEAEGDEALEHDRQALDCYLKARHYHWKVGGEVSKLAADWAVGSAYRRIGEGEKAGAWLRPVLARAERRFELDPSPENGEWVGWACFDLGLLAADAGESERALELLNRAKNLLEHVGIQDWDPKSWKLLNQRIEDLNKS